MERILDSKDRWAIDRLNLEYGFDDKEDSSKIFDTKVKKLIDICGAYEYVINETKYISENHLFSFLCLPITKASVCGIFAVALSPVLKIVGVAVAIYIINWFLGPPLYS